jgi:hypothetical protein
MHVDMTSLLLYCSTSQGDLFDEENADSEDETTKGDSLLQDAAGIDLI